MSHINFDYSKAMPFFGSYKLSFLEQTVESIHHEMHSEFTDHKKYLGWIDLPSSYDEKEFNRIQTCAKRIQETSDILLVIGIGGSYLGARAAIEMLNHSFYNLLPTEKRKAPQILFVGHNLSSTYITHVIDLLANKEFSINIISKSGTTTENQRLRFGFFESYSKKSTGKNKRQNESTQRPIKKKVR